MTELPHSRIDGRIGDSGIGWDQTITPVLVVSRAGVTRANRMSMSHNTVISRSDYG
jgi:hypothetical protein